jgi:hypothetical protein
MRRTLLLCALASALYGDDVSSGVPLPGLRSANPAVRLNAAQVDLRAGDSVELLLRLEVPQESRKQTSLSLTLARFAAKGEGEPYPDRHFPELRSSEMKGDTVRAFARGVDITPRLRSAGIDPLVAGQSGPPIVAIANSALARQLVQTGALRSLSGEYFAAWELERELRFQPSASSELRISYKARPAFELLNPDQFTKLAADWATRYCLPAIGAIGNRSQQAFEYEIPVSVNGRSANAVTLSIALAEDATVAFCDAEGKSVLQSRTRTIASAPARAAGGSIHILKLIEVR